MLKTCSSSRRRTALMSWERLFRKAECCRLPIHFAGWIAGLALTAMVLAMASPWRPISGVPAGASAADFSMTRPCTPLRLRYPRAVWYTGQYSRRAYPLRGAGPGRVWRPDRGVPVVGQLSDRGVGRLSSPTRSVSPSGSRSLFYSPVAGACTPSAGSGNALPDLFDDAGSQVCCRRTGATTGRSNAAVTISQAFSARTHLLGDRASRCNIAIESGTLPTR